MKKPVKCPNYNLNPLSRVSGVMVTASACSRPANSIPNQQVSRDTGDHRVYTQSDGQWYADIAMNDTYGIQLRMDHPEFCSYETSQFQNENQNPEILNPFFKLEQTAVLEEGIPFDGIVADMSGNPLEGVDITAGHGNFPQSFENSFHATSNAAGEFNVRFKRKNNRVLIFRKDGYLGTLKELSDAHSGELNISMKTGHHISVHVTDSGGHPVPGAYVGPTASDILTLSLTGYTDTAGKWHTESAPDSTISLIVAKAGFQRVRFTGKAGSTDTIEVQLRSQPEIQIAVRDGDSRSPLSEFTVTEGILVGGALTPFWNPSRKHRGIEGISRFSLDTSSPPGGVAFLIEADGYQPQQSETFRSIDSNLSLDFELDKAQLIRGTVQDPSGNPPSEAIIFVMGDYELLGIEKPGYAGFLEAARTHRISHNFIQPGARFEITPGVNTRFLVVASKNGVGIYTDFDPAEQLMLVLEPYSTVDGQTESPGEYILALQSPSRRIPGAPPLVVRLTTTPDSSGYFRFEKVPFGPYELGRRFIPNENDHWYIQNSMAIDERFSLQPDENRSVLTGGIGRVIKGKAVLSNGLTSDIDWSIGRYDMSLAPPVSQIPLRSEFDSDSSYQNAYEKFKEEFTAFASTEEGELFLQNRKEYPIRMYSDGAFESLAVPPGNYLIDLRPEANEQTGQGNQITFIGMGYKMITVPDGADKAPLDIGQVEVELIGRLPAGKNAPDFELKDAGGNIVRLSDFRGKYVFLDFWSTTCGPCIAELPNLREAYDAFKDHPEFVMIALSLDENWETIERFRRKQPMPWKHVRVGPFGTSQVLDDYGVYGIPENFLISPDGIVLRKSMRGVSVFNALRDFLPEAD